MDCCITMRCPDRKGGVIYGAALKHARCTPRAYAWGTAYRTGKLLFANLILQIYGIDSSLIFIARIQ